ncbi:hypothetical protein Tco_0918307 [Tanacetum coccineum]
MTRYAVSGKVDTAYWAGFLGKGKRVKRPAKKSTTAPRVGVAIRDTPGVYVSKKKAPAKAERSKGDGTDFESGVPGEKQPRHLSENESWGDGDDNDEYSNGDSKGDDDKADRNDDGNSDADDNERNDSDDDDENPSLTLKYYDEEEHDEYHQEESSTQAPSLFTVPVMTISETATAHAKTVPPNISMITPPPQLTTPFPAPTTVPTTTSIPALPDFSSLFGFDQRVSTLEMELSQLKQADHSA